MKVKKGQVFSMANDHEPIPGCTVSKSLWDGENNIAVFSLAAHTDISAEIFPSYKLLLVHKGCLTVGLGTGEKRLQEGEALLVEPDSPVGMKAEEDTVYTEMVIRRTDQMNENVKAGEIFKLAELVPYAEGRIVNMDIVHNQTMKFVVMAFDEGTGLTEHAAPGEALIFALDGQGVISYEGRDYPIRAGENFSFAKGGMHAVKADGRFKMALLLTLA